MPEGLNPEQEAEAATFNANDRMRANEGMMMGADQKSEVRQVSEGGTSRFGSTEGEVAQTFQEGIDESTKLREENRIAAARHVVENLDSYTETAKQEAQADGKEINTEGHSEAT